MTTTATTLYKIISGGQTGADQGGLEAGEALGLTTGGWATDGYWTIDGKNAKLGTRFGLVEMEKYANISDAYIARSIANVDSSDGTIAFRLYASAGTDKTIGYCATEKWKVMKTTKGVYVACYKPCLVIDNVSYANQDANVAKIRNFLTSNNIAILNICGHRDARIGGFQLQDIVKKLLTAALLPNP